ncbi:BRCT domain-containing protein [Fusarium falciforme]|uniref:BRCT domain-containing protein n=1 Tax=Fusarium falciforme TaxID=195108 RepID=UPI002301DA66|nr:BRCT domain-containing protein [Fusarium falciforme]WAO94121.1 BRCT domain-containing protein [Fusarium falciforme]
MTHSEMLAHAGSNESQDSQAILEAYRAEFGVGALSSPPSKVSFSRTRMTTIKEIPSPTNEVVVPSSDTPVATIACPEVHAPRDALPTEARSEGSTVEQGECPEPSDLNGDEEDSENRVDLTSNESLDSQRPCDLSHHIGNEKLHTRHDSAQPQSVQRDAPGPLIQSVKPPTSAAAAALLCKMNFSQQTPTQVNDGRDYSEYCDVVPSSPVNNDTQSGSHEPETLQDDDTGAVNFALSELNRPSSQVSEDAGFENTRGDWRHPDQTSQLNAGQTPCRPHGNAFETPAVPKNPFGARPSITAPLAGSQLFGQTQFSSAIKRISPTSSRPSPNLFNSISPNIIETSPLKNRANVSSPTDIRTSSPQRLHDIPETSLQDEDADPRGAETPLNSRSTGGDMIPESPPSSDPTPRAQPRSSGNTEPMTHYEPMKKSQERKSSEGAAVSSPLDSDSDPDDAIRRMERKKKIERKRAKAAEEMGRVSFIPMAKRESAEQPSRKRRRVSTAVSVPAHEQPQEKTDDAKAQELPTLVDDSQKGVVASNETAPGASTKATPGNSAPEKEQVDGDGDLAMVDTQKVTEEEDMIPATSPAPSLPPSLPPTEASLPPTAPPEDPLPSEPELPKLIVDDEDGPGTARGDSEPSSLPPQRRRNMRTYGRSLRQSRKTPFVSSSNSDALVAETAPKPMSLSSPPRKPESMATIEHGDDHGLVARKGTPDEGEAKKGPRSKRAPRSVYADLPPPMTTRSRRSEASPVTPVANRPIAQMLPTSSSLSILSTTPQPSAKTTPGTQDSPSSKRAESVSLPSPAGGRGLRKRAPRAGTKSESPPAATRATRMAKRLPRLDSESTDELHHSPAASVLERSLIHSKSSRSFRQSLAPVHRTCKLFEGMVFAISFQNQVKQQERTKLETKITQAGGTILAEGFQDMFEHSSIMNTTSLVIDEEDALKLTKAGCESGFTALIADSHSRKAKYMQALALGLPCLAHQWITACLNKGAIVDWEPYILCAGASAVLGNAIRSRTLTPYSAVDAKLAEVIDQRPRLLDGQRVLVVVDSKKSRNDAKEPYIFLATVLGPSISRVFSTQQARDVLQEHEKAGNPFDWLYIDKGTGTVEAVLGPTEVTGNKRRRKSSQVPLRVGNMRVLDDELVIQSLILGRIVEVDEMYS